VTVSREAGEDCRAIMVEKARRLMMVYIGQYPTEGRGSVCRLGSVYELLRATQSERDIQDASKSQLPFGYTFEFVDRVQLP
jgi:hypothetical protein